jgi:hypothetical protein
VSNYKDKNRNPDDPPKITRGRHWRGDVYRRSVGIDIVCEQAYRKNSRYQAPNYFQRHASFLWDPKSPRSLADGTQERILLPKFSRWYDNETGIGARGKAFSPDSKSVALLCNAMIYVIDLEGKIKSQAGVPPESSFQLLGWRPNGLEVLLFDTPRIRFEVYDVAKTQFRTVYQATHSDSQRALNVPGMGVRYIVRDNELIDLDKGSSQPLSLNRQFDSADISLDQSVLMYSKNSDRSHPENASSFIHRLYTKTGHDEPCAEFKGFVHRLRISPDGSKTAIELFDGSHQFQTVVLDGNIQIRTFAGWGLVGWRDSQRAVLANNSIFPQKMGLGDIKTGQIQQFYP